MSFLEEPGRRSVASREMMQQEVLSSRRSAGSGEIPEHDGLDLWSSRLEKPWWAELGTDLHGNKAELTATLDKDLSKTMTAMQDQLLQPSDPSGLCTLDSSDRQVPPEAAAFRHQAVAARDEMLSGLARLRGELVTQRLQPGSGSASLDGDQYRQKSPEPFAVAELQQKLSVQQAAIMELRCEFATQRQLSQRSHEDLELEISRLRAESATSSARGNPGGMANAIYSSEKLEVLTSRIGVLEDLKPELADLRGDIAFLREAAASERLERPREISAARFQATLEQIVASVEAEVERRAADVEGLHRRLDEFEKSAWSPNSNVASGSEGTLAINIQELAEGLSLERASRHAQVTAVQGYIVEEIQSNIVDFVAKATAQLRNEAQQSVEVLGAELRAEFQGGVATNRLTPAGREAGQHSTMAAVSREWACDAMSSVSQGFDEDLTIGDGLENQAGPTQSVMSEDLKESLVQLVDKVNKTLRGPPAGSAPASATVSTAAASGASGDPHFTLQGQQQHQQPQQAQHPLLQQPGQAPQQQQQQQQQHFVRRMPSAAQPVYAVQIAQPTVQVRKWPASVAITQTAPAEVGKPANALPLSSKKAPALPMQRLSSVVMSAVPGVVPSFVQPVLMEAPETKEDFQRCLQELREENAALRSAVGAPST